MIICRKAKSLAFAGDCDALFDLMSLGSECALWRNDFW